MQSHIFIKDNIAKTLVDKNLFNKEAVMAAAYRLIDRYSIEMREEGSDLVAMFTLKEGQQFDASTINTEMLSFYNDILDEQLRLTLEQKTGKIRDLIVKHAFSPIDLKKELESECL